MSDNCHSHVIKATGSPNSILCDNDFCETNSNRIFKKTFRPSVWFKTVIETNRLKSRESFVKQIAVDISITIKFLFFCRLSICFLQDDV